MLVNKEGCSLIQPSYKSDSQNVTEIHISDNQTAECSVFESRKGYTSLQMSYDRHSESFTDIQRSNTKTPGRSLLENS